MAQLPMAVSVGDIGGCAVAELESGSQKVSTKVEISQFQLPTQDATPYRFLNFNWLYEFPDHVFAVFALSGRHALYVEGPQKDQPIHARDRDELAKLMIQQHGRGERYVPFPGMMRDSAEVRAARE